MGRRVLVITLGNLKNFVNLLNLNWNSQRVTSSDFFERVREVDKHLVEKNVEMIFAVGRHISTFRPKMKQNVETQFPNFDISSKNGVKRRMSAKCVRSTVYIMADSAIDRKA